MAAKAGASRSHVVRRISLVAFTASTARLPLPSEAKRVQSRADKLELADVTYQLCADPVAAGTPGTSSYKAQCYELRGVVYNRTGKQVYNADVFGTVLDANDDPVLRSGRVGSIQNIPPGESRWTLQITVAASQPPPFQLQRFRASGFTGTVNRQENPYETDFETNVFPSGGTTIKR